MARAAGSVAEPGVIERATRVHNPPRVLDRVNTPRPRGDPSIQENSNRLHHCCARSKMENKIVKLARRKSAAADQNKMILERMRGVPAQRGTPETDADPQNPNLRKPTA